MSAIEDSVARKILNRALVGKDKYGVTMERTDLTDLEWMEHAQSESMDFCVYLEKMIQNSAAKSPSVAMHGAYLEGNFIDVTDKEF